MENDKILDTVVEGLPYEFKKDILVKPLPAVKIIKEITEQVPTGEKDEEGFEKYDTQTTSKEIESDLAKGIIIALPNDKILEANQLTLNLGDTIIYPKKFAKEFDLFKDSMLVKPYDVIAVEKKK